MNLLMLQTIAQTPSVPPNLTVLFSVLAVVVPICIAALIASVKIASIKGAKIDEADKPSLKNDYCKQQVKEFNRMEKRVENGETNVTAIQSTIGELKITIAELQKDVESTTKTIGEMRQDNRDLAQKLEGLLTQLINYVGD